MLREELEELRALRLVRHQSKMDDDEEHLYG